TVLGRIDALRGQRPELARLLTAMQGDSDQGHAPLHAAVLSGLERIDRLESGPYAAAWRRLVGVLALLPNTPEGALRAAVLTDVPDEDAVAVAAKCFAAAFWLLMAEIDPTHPARMPRDADDLTQIVDKRGAAEWRRVLAIIAANPWGPEVARLAEMAREAELS